MDGVAEHLQLKARHLREIRGRLRKAPGDRHHRAAELHRLQSGVILGAGFEAEENTSGYLKITTVYKGSSAELNGVLAGDIITAIDGKSLLSMQQGQAMERLSGEVGTRLALQLLRDGESISVNLVRQQLEIESVSTRMIDNIGYIQITSFNAKTAEQFANAMTTMNSVGAKALIVDVRQNPGGVVSALKPILNQFVPSAIAATVEYSDGSRKTLIETDSTNSVELPIAVLVDGGTVSAAELFAAVLRDEAGALIDLRQGSYAEHLRIFGRQRPDALRRKDIHEIRHLERDRTQAGLFRRACGRRSPRKHLRRRGFPAPEGDRGAHPEDRR